MSIHTPTNLPPQRCTSLRRRMSTIAPIAITLLASLCPTIQAADAAKPERQMLMEETVVLPSPAFNTIMRTITWPVGYRSKEHSHPGPGPRYVLQGTVEITENGSTTRYGAGDVFWYSADYPHTAENVDSIPTTVLIVEMLPPI